MTHIWQRLKKPIMILAPMEDVTDSVFRQIIADCGRPDLFFTEFTSVDGMCSKGEKIVTQRLQYTPKEKPIIAQIWGITPEHYFEATRKIIAMGFAGVDINMGCPQRSVIRQGACSALIQNRPLAAQIIQATLEAANGKIPVSIKTRLGFKTVDLSWIDFLLDFDLAALTIHGRTAAEMSEPPAKWDVIHKIVTLRNAKGKETLIIGNGDVKTLTEAREKVAAWGVDGIMIGRGIFENPWLFDEQINPSEKSLTERCQLLLQHVRLYHKTWGEEKPFKILKKYFKIYLHGFPYASEIRAQLMEAENKEDVEKTIEKYSIGYV